MVSVLISIDPSFIQVLRSELLARVGVLVLPVEYGKAGLSEARY